MWRRAVGARRSGWDQRRDRPLVLCGGRGVDEVVDDGPALQTAALADRADTFDPAAAVLRLRAELDLAQDHGVPERSFGGVVGRVQAGDFAERPQRDVLVEQTLTEAGGLGVPAAGALVQQCVDGFAVRVKLAW